jgi:hypothetical protein
MEHVLEVAAAEDGGSGRGSRRERCALSARAWAFAFGAWTGVRIILMPSLRKTSSKAWLNFVSRSWMRNRKGCSLPSSMTRLRACWVTQRPSGFELYARYRRLRSQEGSPCRAPSPWRRLETCFKQDLAYGGRRNRDAENLELADDPFVSPVRVLRSETQDQLAERAFERRSHGPPVRVCPPAFDQRAVAAKQRLRLEREGRPRRPRQRAAQRRQQRPISPGQLRPDSPPTEDRQLVAEDEDLQLLRAIRPSQQPDHREQVSHNEIHKRPEQTALPRPCKSAELSDLDAPESRGRVREPYGFDSLTIRGFAEAAVNDAPLAKLGNVIRRGGSGRRVRRAAQASP